ncbi:MAG TPA: TspO/MBR family protein [Xanthobacteraceae bacterium]|nr:TspO/MBR family protein [Xanthobacteraceae bacterium]
MESWPALLVLLMIVAAVGWYGGVVTLPKIPNWYAGLVKPSFNPPPWVFGPVWTSLYILMAIAAWRVWSSEAPQRAKRTALVLFGIQLFLNALWSPLFFGAERPLWAFVDIVLLCGFVVLTLVRFAQIDRPAGWMLAPYLVWIVFAAVLNGAIVFLNPATMAI